MSESGSNSSDFNERAPAASRIHPPVDPATLTHKQLLSGPFWQKIPAYADIDEATFLDHKWQSKHTITRIDKLLAAIGDLVPESFIKDVEAGFKKAPMAMRVPPYLFSLINWADPYNDPLRIQFVPVGSRFLPDHPELGLDSLGEQADAPVKGLTHRYPDKALFLVIDTCPVYCRFCTRSYAVGLDTEKVEKVHLRPKRERWDDAIDYIASRPELEDIVISGGDSYNLRADWVRDIGTRLLQLDNIRRIRYASRGLSAMPQKILTDNEWFDAIAEVNKLGRELGKEVCFHTHFNSPNEISYITQMALNKLHREGVFVRNQTVLLRGVNDTIDTMGLLVKRLSYINAHPYYVYMHDMVMGAEDMRTTLQTALDLEKQVRGITAGFNTPTFVTDAPGGGGKRMVHSYEAYDRESGISVWTAPSVKPGKRFYYFDPIDQLSPEAQEAWWDPVRRKQLAEMAREMKSVR